MADPQDTLVWRKIASEPGPNIRIMRARYDTFEHPVSGKPLRATVLEARPWCLIVPFTDDGRLVMVRQFRFGVAEVTLEIPAGLIDRGEEHADTARRELREETGYEADRWTYLGDLFHNPAAQDNIVHLWLAEGATLVHATELDDGEHIEVALFAPEDVRAAVWNGALRHPHVIAALSQVLDLRRPELGAL